MADAEIEFDYRHGHWEVSSVGMPAGASDAVFNELFDHAAVIEERLNALQVPESKHERVLGPRMYTRKDRRRKDGLPNFWLVDEDRDFSPLEAQAILEAIDGIEQGLWLIYDHAGRLGPVREQGIKIGLGEVREMLKGIRRRVKQHTTRDMGPRREIG